MIPAPIKWLLGVWLALWLPLHLAAYPVSTFLWMCAYGNVVVVLGIIFESRLILSWQAVALLVPQTLYAAEAFARLVTGARGGGTSYLFDPGLPFDVRALSFFHFLMPVLLVWAIRRVGYDRRALPIQLATALVVSVASLPVGPINVWCLPLAREHPLAAVVLVPLALHVPADVYLRSLAPLQALSRFSHRRTSFWRRESWSQDPPRGGYETRKQETRIEPDGRAAAQAAAARLD